MDIEKGNECCCSNGQEQRMTVRENKLKANLMARLNRVEGQIRGIKGMIERDAYCDDILHQLTAARAALDAVSKQVLENHVRGCVVRKIKNGEDGVVEELLSTIDKML